MCARWRARCAATATSCCQAYATRFASRPVRARTEMPPGSISISMPVRILPGLRALISGIPQVPIAAQIELNSEQVMLGGRPLQDVAAELHTDSKSWTVRRLDFRAPGATRVSLGGTGAQANPSSDFKAALNVESSDPDTLMAWLQGRSEITYRSRKPLRLRC